MIEITRSITGMAKKLENVSDIAELLEWAHDQDDIFCMVVARTDKVYTVELGGTIIDSVVAQLGNWVVYDGDRFHVLTQDEFEAKGYSEQAGQ